MSNHSLFTAVHRPFAAVYADATARLAATGFPRGLGGSIVPFDTDDLYKEVLQLSDASRWILTDESPVTWVQTSGTGSVSVDNSTIEISGGNLRVKDAGVTDAKLATSYIKQDGTRAFTGDQSMGSHKLTNVTDPGSAQDAATKAYVDAQVSGGAVSDEHIQDVVGALLADGDVDFNYDDPGASETNVVRKASEDFALPGDISPSQLTANTDNWNPTGLSTASTIRFSTDAARNITGLQGGADGRLMILHNIGSQNAVLKDESASSTAGNRFALNADVTLGADQSALFQYDSTSSRWRLVAGPSAGGSGIGGSTGSTDNAILRADGTGGSTAQSSGSQINDSGVLIFPSGAGDRIYWQSNSQNYGAGVESDNAVTIWSQDHVRVRNGGTSATGGSLVFQASGSGPLTVTSGAVGVNILDPQTIRFRSSTGDKTYWQGGSTAYGTGIEADNCVTNWSQDRHRWRIGGSSVTSGTETMVLTAATLAFTNGTTLAFTPRTPGQITANQNNYNPGGQSKFQRWSSDASRDVTGLTFSVAQITGEEHMIVNVGSNNIVLKHQDANSSATNRFLCSTGADITLGADQAADVIYDGTTGRWRVFKRN